MIMWNYKERNGIFMSKDQVRKVHLIYGCMTALLIVIVAVGLIVSCVAIYQSGDRPFSREAVTLAFRQLAVPGWLCLAAVVGGIVLHFALPLPAVKDKGIRSEKDTLQRYDCQYPQLPSEAQEKVCKERKLRRTYKFAAASVIVLLAVYPVIYYADASHFSVANLNSDIIHGVLVVLVPTVAALLLVYLCGQLEFKSIHREIEIYKVNSLKPGKVIYADRNDRKRMTLLRSGLIAAAVILIIMGIMNGGVADVLGKAIRICTECIGLG